MRVTITVGNATREFDVRSDLLVPELALQRGARHGHIQDEVMRVVGSNFVAAYREEYDRVMATGDKKEGD